MDRFETKRLKEQTDSPALKDTAANKPQIQSIKLRKYEVAYINGFTAVQKDFKNKSDIVQKTNEAQGLDFYFIYLFYEK